MSEPDSKLEADRQLLIRANEEGGLTKLGAYAKLSGPGWLQSAITLGGGSLAGSLYLGVLAGFTLMWLQPFAMILGIIMLSAIGYVTLSTGERPFQAINRHVNPVLGWGWALASLLANIVWSLPQYSLATAVLQQNLLPDLLSDENGGKYVIVGAILVISTIITWSYDSGGWGIKLYERALKVLVGLIVLCFMGVVIRLSLAAEGNVDWGLVLAGFIPDFGAMFRPAATYTPILEQVADPAAREYWSQAIVAQQRDVMISAAATAVGINMTFLFPYSLLRRGWGKEFRGFQRFDLATGMLIPFLLATSCVVISSASRFHAGYREDPVGEVLAGSAAGAGAFHGELAKRVYWAENDRQPRDGELAAFLSASALDDAALRARVAMPEQQLATALVKRDAFDLAASLRPLTGDVFAKIIFGAGVLGMALSTITLLMLISGFVICEIFGLPQGGWPHRLGCLVSGLGVLGPFVWSGEAKFWLAVPTSVFGFMLLPIAYVTFFFLMNQKRLLGEEMPQGGRRVAWNVLMGIAALTAGVGSVYMVWVKVRWAGLAAVGAFLALAAIVQVARPRRAAS